MTKTLAKIWTWNYLFKTFKDLTIVFCNCISVTNVIYLFYLPFSLSSLKVVVVVVVVAAAAAAAVALLLVVVVVMVLVVIIAATVVKVAVEANII